jgi:hypothetical protein
MRALEDLMETTEDLIEDILNRRMPEEARRAFICPAYWEEEEGDKLKRKRKKNRIGRTS